jgi:hypothetical protein
MAQLTRNFLTNGPIAGDSGDISAGRAYNVVWQEINRAITNASNTDDENSKKIIDELKTLRNHLRDEAQKNASKRISELPPGVAREFLDVSRSIKQIIRGTGTTSDASPATRSDFKQLITGIQQSTSSLRSQAFRGGGPIGTAAMAGADALVPGAGIVVKAIQENSQAIKDTFHAVKGLFGVVGNALHFAANTFTAIHNFLNPEHPHSLLKSLSKLFKGGGLISSLFSGLSGLLLSVLGVGGIGGEGLGLGALLLLPILRIVGGGLAISGAFIVADMIKKEVADLRDKMGYTPEGKWETGIDFGKWFTLNYDPKIWGWLVRLFGGGESGGGRSLLQGGGTPQVGRGVVVGGQIEPVSFNLEAGGMKLLQGGFNEGFNTGVKGDTILELMKKQTGLLGEILKALLGGRQGTIKAYQTGGVIPPGQLGLVGEGDGPEAVRAGGQSGVVTKPSILAAGKDPIIVTPKQLGPNLPSGAYAAQLASQQAFIGPSLPHGQTFVSPIGNPNVNQALLKTNNQGLLSAALRANNPGAISGDEATAARKGGYRGEQRSPGEASPPGSLTDPRNYYAKFDTPEEGIRAQSQVLLKTYAERGKDTIHDIIYGGYADRGQAEYVKHVSEQMGIGPNEKLNLAANPQNLAAYMKASQTHEVGKGGLPYTPETYERALTGKDMEHWSVRNPESLTPKLHPGYEKDGGSKGYRVKADPGQQNVNLSVKGSGPTAPDMHRDITRLQDAKHREQHERPQRQTQTPERHSEHQAPVRRSQDRVAFTGVGVVAVSARSGFS